MKNEKEIVFVYNANKGVGSAALDWLHKAVSPETYQCDLCSLTYGNFGMKKEWSEFISSLPYPTKFLYRQDLSDYYEPLMKEALPLVALDLGDGKFDILISADEMKNMSLEDLQNELRLKLEI